MKAFLVSVMLALSAPVVAQAPVNKIVAVNIVVECNNPVAIQTIGTLEQTWLVKNDANVAKFNEVLRLAIQAGPKVIELKAGCLSI